MNSIEVLRRYPFFAGFSNEELGILARASDELSVDAGHFFFFEEDEIDSFYLVLEGNVDITIDIPDRANKQNLVRQLTDDLEMTGITVSNVGPGNTFGWSALIPPNISTASAKATVSSRVLKFYITKLQPAIEADCCFGHLLTLKAAQVVRQRLRDIRMETLAEHM